MRRDLVGETAADVEHPADDRIGAVAMPHVVGAAVGHLGLLGGPAEHRLVELLGAVGVAGVELVPGERDGLVDHTGAGERARLPDPEDGAARVGEDRHPAEVHDLHRLGEHLAPGIGDSAGGGAGVGDRDVARPGRRLAFLHQRHHPGDGLAVAHRLPVSAGLLGVRALGDRPAEQGLVEAHRRLEVGGSEVHPGRGAGLVAADLGHLLSPSRGVSDSLMNPPTRCCRLDPPPSRQAWAAKIRPRS